MLVDKTKTAIKRIQHFEPPEGYYLAFSGGKDSIVIKALADMSKVKYDAHYSNTTIDPPELISFIRKYNSDVIWDQPKEPFVILLARRGFPLRQHRWCCGVYKEQGGIGRFVITGIRWQESGSRKNRKMVEICYINKYQKKFLHPIIDWTESDVWNFIRTYNLNYCKLYDEGWKRIGCLMCPNASKKQRLLEAEKYPRYTKLFKKAFEKLYNNRKQRGMKSVDRWKSGKEMFDWWLGTPKPSKPKQKQLFK